MGCAEAWIRQPQITGGHDLRTPAANRVHYMASHGPDPGAVRRQTEPEMADLGHSPLHALRRLPSRTRSPATRRQAALGPFELPPRAARAGVRDRVVRLDVVETLRSRRSG